MKVAQQKLGSVLLVVVAACLTIVLASHAQSPQPTSGAPASSTAGMDAERAAIWNSPNMLRARAWLQDYCATSAKVKPGEGEKYMNELANMTPTQMKLWLMKFDEEEEGKQQQQQLWKHAHSAALKQAMAADQATDKSLADISSEETQAAGQEEQQINEETQNQQNLEGDKQIEQGAYGPGAGGVHYHFHLYPY